MDEDENVLVDDKGDYRFTLKLITAQSGQPDLLEKAFRTDPKPLTFELNLPYLAIQHLAFQNGTQVMFNKSWKPAMSESTESGLSKVSPSSRTTEPDNAPQSPPQSEPDGRAAP